MSATDQNRILTAFRICLGLLMMLESFQIWSSIDSLYGPYGFLEAGLMNAISGWSAPSFADFFELHGINYLSFLHLLFWVRWIFLLTFTFGFWQRTSTAALWLFQVVIMASGSVSSYGVDRYFHVFLFILVWMPLLKPEWTLRVMQIALLITYINAGASKAVGVEWLNGEAVWRVFNLPEFSRISFLWMAQLPWLPMILGWATLLFEIFYIVGVWIPRLRLVWILAIIGMHLSIALFMGLVNFGVAMALINIILFWPVIESECNWIIQKLPQLNWFNRTTN